MSAEDHAQLGLVLSSSPREVSMTDTAIIRVTDDTPPEMLEVLIAAECHRAKRCVPKCGSEDHPTPWDLHHRRIDALLGDLLAWAVRPTRMCTANCGPDCRDCA